MPARLPVQTAMDSPASSSPLQFNLSLDPSPPLPVAALPGSSMNDAKHAEDARESPPALPQSPSESRVSILPGTLFLTSLKFPQLSASLSALLRLLFLGDPQSLGFLHLTITDDEISLLLDERALSLFPPDALSLSPGSWRALQIEEGPEILDQPGIVSSLCAPLSAMGFDMLYVSMYNSDLILVKENHVDAAFGVLSNSLNFLLEKIARSQALAEGIFHMDQKHNENEKNTENNKNQQTDGSERDDLFEVSLSRSPRPLALLGLHRRNLPMCAFAIMKAILYDPILDGGSEGAPKRPFFSYTACGEEISIVSDESLAENFPPALVTKFPQGWNALQLSLGSVGFDQFALVAPVSSLLARHGVSIFFLSTFDTDFTLVAASEVQRAIAVMKENLNVLFQE